MDKEEIQGRVNNIFQLITRREKENIYCIFNQLPYGHKLKCNNKAVFLHGDLNGAVFVCNECLIKDFKFDVGVINT